MKVKVNEGQAVTHSDRTYGAGEELDLPKASADLLIDRDVVSEVKTSSPAKAEKKEGES